MEPSYRILSVVALCAAVLFPSADRLFGEETLENRFELVLPTKEEETWREVGWLTNLMEAREVAQKQNRPIFLWIMVGNPHGCT